MCKKFSKKIKFKKTKAPFTQAIRNTTFKRHHNKKELKNRRIKQKKAKSLNI